MSKNIIGYDVIYQKNLDNLISKVKKKIVVGWIPLGGVSTRSTPSPIDKSYITAFYQTMIKYETIKYN